LIKQGAAMTSTNDGSRFEPPVGTTFRTNALMQDELAALLHAVVAFLEATDPHAPLTRYDDWFEHDGMHVLRGKITFAILWEIVATPQVIFEETPQDDDVRIGISDALGR
jgi:hypothetical protein